MKEKSTEKQIQRLEQQYFKYENNPNMQTRILGRITTLKNTNRKRK